MSETKIILSPMQRLLGEDFNPALLVIMVRKSLVWCIVIMLFTISASLVYLRYTKPTYEVTASLIVKPINTAQALDIQNNLFQAKNSNLDIEKDIQIMKANVIMDRVIDSLNLQIAYFHAGKILNEELYRNNPFIVRVTQVNDNFYDRPIQFRVLDGIKYQLNFGADGKENWQTFEFGKHYVTRFMQFTITTNLKAAETESLSSSEYFFIVLNPSTLYGRLRSGLQIAPNVPTIGLV